MRNLLIYRMALFSLACTAGVAWAFARGYVQSVFADDITGISYGIVALFLVGLFSAFRRGAKVSGMLNRLQQNYSIHVNGPKLIERNAHVGDIASWLMLIGLLGTVIGFRHALAGMDLSQLGTAEGAKAIGDQFIAGASIAIGTTIVGAVAALWLDVLRRMLATATTTLVEDGK